MGLRDQFASVVEWQQEDSGQIFWKWHGDEIKKGSRLIIHPGQDAIFLYNGRVEGIFQDEGSFDIESEIVPFLSTLKGFRFGFNSGIRAEVLFVNTKEMTEKWGTKNPINLPAEGLAGGMPIRAFGTFSCKVADYAVLIDKVAGVSDTFTIDQLRERMMSKLGQYVMKEVAAQGVNIFYLQASADVISSSICEDLDYEMRRIGIAITDFVIENVSYPEQVQQMAEKVAAQSMVQGNMDTYRQMAINNSLEKGDGAAGSTAASMAGIGAGIAMGRQIADELSRDSDSAGTAGEGSKKKSAGAPVGTDSGKHMNFCPNCGAKLNGPGHFCPNCGAKLD